MRREDRAPILATLTERVVARQLEKNEDSDELRARIASSAALELARVRQSKRSPRDDSDLGFWRGVQLRLGFTSDLGLPGLLGDIVSRYAEEVGGSFDPTLYKVATRLLPPALALLLTGVYPTRLLRRLPRVPDFSDRVRVGGEIEQLRALREKGTLVLCPTHASNLDSIVLGVAAHRIEVPPLVYGAGINLLSNPLMSLFMHNFGAYTVDRDKKDPLYKEVLKEYTTLTLEHGYANLFFPGGTRSRSGAIEQSLKLGLLGTTVPALRNNLRSANPRPGIFVVPITLSFELVLEAESLIAGFLARELEEEEPAGARATERDDARVAGRIAEFIDSLIALDSRIDVVVGPALDPLGNPVDTEGTSLTENATAIDLAAVLEDGDFEAVAREGTRRLGETLARSYLRDNVVKTTHLLAKAVVLELRAEAADGGIEALLLARGRTRLAGAAVLTRLERVLDQLRQRCDQGRLRLAPPLLDTMASPESLAEKATETFDSYYRSRPVLERRGESFELSDRSLLFYYQNRLEGYGIDREHGMPALLSESHERLRLDDRADTEA